MKLLQIHPADNVAVDTESGFKAALTDIAAGESVIKYGMPIGHATRDIKAGERVHTDNIYNQSEGGLYDGFESAGYESTGRKCDCK